MLFFKSLCGDGEDFDKAHGEIETSIRAVAAGRLQQRFEAVIPQLHEQDQHVGQAQQEGGGHGEAGGVVVQAQVVAQDKRAAVPPSIQLRLLHGREVSRQAADAQEVALVEGDHPPEEAQVQNKHARQDRQQIQKDE